MSEATYPSIGKIKEAVGAAYGVTPRRLAGPQRCAPALHPRRVAIYLARELTPHPLPVIGLCFGRRSTDAVRDSIKTLKRMMVDDAALAARVDALITELRG